MKTGLILEGGAMRGLYTAGVLDVFMENNITFDATIGVSAGAAFGCNFKSKQIGRAIRYNKKYCNDRRYCSFYNLLVHGDVYEKNFCYNKLPFELDIFDTKTYQENQMPFYVTVTDADTGKAVYHRCDKGDKEDLLWIRASASMPVFSKIVTIDKHHYSDGGTADSIPIKAFSDMGYSHSVLILTRSPSYRKKENKHMGIISFALRRYPALIQALKDRPKMYNDTLDYIKKQQEEHKILVIQPKQELGIKQMEKNPDELQRIYEEGRKDGLKALMDVKNFLV